VQALEQWPRQRPFAVDQSLRDITLAVILEATLGLQSGPEFEEISRRVSALTSMGATPWALLLTKIAEISHLDQASFMPFNRNLRRIDELLYASITRRRNARRFTRQTEAPSSDILDDLVRAEHADGSTMSDVEIRDAIMTALLAGHETTATALAWTLELILPKPDVLLGIRAEIDRVTGGGALQAVHLPELVYLDAVIRESLRMRTVIPFVTRLLKAPAVIEGRTYPVGVQLCPCIHLVHRREELYPYPDEFRPERFLRRRFGPHEWLPFGGGNRLCLGMQFALFEMRVILASMLTLVQLKRPAGARSRVARRGVVLAPADGTVVIQA
jgi:cytochrome P450